jgi:DNA-binding NarL/FixJ family response regulator
MARPSGSSEASASAASVVMDRHEKAATMVRSLSRREAEVLHCLVDGCASKVIARKLGLSPRTVEIYRSSLLKKLKVHTSLAAACIGAYAGFGDCDNLRPAIEQPAIELAGALDLPPELGEKA